MLSQSFLPSKCPWRFVCCVFCVSNKKRAVVRNNLLTIPIDNLDLGSSNYCLHLCNIHLGIDDSITSRWLLLGKHYRLGTFKYCLSEGGRWKSLKLANGGKDGRTKTKNRNLLAEECGWWEKKDRKENKRTIAQSFLGPAITFLIESSV